MEIPSRSTLGHLCGHQPFEDILEDVLEDVFGLLPRPEIGGHDGPGAAGHPMETPKNRNEDGVCFETCVMDRFFVR